ncbi:MAG: FHA domain-containing protein [Planctomycetota bacterium]|nr:FHA domain-containing protein [Planctomycetota bacterium]
MATILFIDSDTHLKSSLTKFCQDKHELFLFDKWAQAVSCMARKKIDLAIIGTKIAGFDCKQIVQMVRPSVKGKVLVAGAEEESRSIARKYNADGYICKNQSGQQIKERLSTYLVPNEKLEGTKIAKSTRDFLKPAGPSAEEQTDYSVLSKLLLENRSATTFIRLARTSGNLSREEFVQRHKHCSLQLIKDAETLQSGAFKQTRIYDRSQLTKQRHSTGESVIIPLDKKVMTVGRSASCDIRIRDNRISKFHAYIRCDSQNNWSIQDSNSTNGTFISSERIAPDSSFILNSRITLRFSDFCSFKFMTPELTFINMKYYK